MKIENYQIAMDTNYYNLEFEQTDAKVSTNSSTMSNDKSNELLEIQVDKKSLDDTYNQLSEELSRAILKNISGEVRNIKRDTIEISSSYVEAEALNFKAKAVVKTKDREIDISLDVSLSRSFVKKTSITMDIVEEAAFIDPLVLSLNGSMPSLSSKTFSFDIDSDGKPDQISQLGRNSAFLALDKNNNGVIDDGNELFGTKSGNGFADLRKYDEDKNGWIDENDAIFDKLRVWQKDGVNNRLIAIGEVGIGAIYLGDTKTQFSLKDDMNNSLGDIKSSSMFLFENGRAGILSHIDFAVDKKTNDKLDALDDISKKSLVLNLENIYADSSKDSSKDSETMLDKLKDRLRVLQAKLLIAKGDDRLSIEAQIAGIQSQIMAMLDR